MGAGPVASSSTGSCGLGVPALHHTALSATGSSNKALSRVTSSSSLLCPTRRQEDLRDTPPIAWALLAVPKPGFTTPKRVIPAFTRNKPHFLPGDLGCFHAEGSSPEHSRAPTSLLPPGQHLPTYHGPTRQRRSGAGNGDRAGPGRMGLGCGMRIQLSVTARQTDAQGSVPIHESRVTLVVPLLTRQTQMLRMET